MDNLRRINHIFKEDGKTLILALEHTIIFGPGKGLDKPGETILKALAGGVDAVMTTYGIARHFSEDLSRTGLILRSDGASTKLGPDVSAPVWFGINEALQLDADALCISAFPGNHKEMSTFNNLAATTRNAHRWGLAVQAEMMPGGMGASPEFLTKENVALAARAGLELGGDWVKIPYVDGFREIVDACYKPVVIMGLTKRPDPVDFLTEMKAAMDSGASGGTIGRNIFEADNPQAMAAALSAIIHQGISVSEALSISRG